MSFLDTLVNVPFLVLVLMSLPAIADQTEQPTTTTPQKNYLMAAMGDSITAGFLAATQLDWFNTNLTLSQEAQDF